MSFEEQAAGFFTAEGHFGSSFTREFLQTKLEITQKERYWLDVLRNHYQAGNIHKVSGAECWRWNVGASLDAEALYGHFISQPITIDWIVGFWEGDGNISKNPNFRSPSVGFANNDKHLLERIKQILNSHHKIGAKPDYDTGAYTSFQLRLRGQPARSFIPVLYSRVISPVRRQQLKPFMMAMQLE